MKNFIYRGPDYLILFRLGKTSNKKIALPGENILQSYSFSRGQFEEAKGKTNMKNFFAHDQPVCGNCPFAVNNGAKLSACYTHKFMQYSGFLSSLRAIAKIYPEWENIPEFSQEIRSGLINAAKGRYIRFGSYGEPSLISLDVVSDLCQVAKNWTGYTHQWQSRPQYAPYFMASTHGVADTLLAGLSGFRAFATSEQAPDAIHCPASKEAGYKSHCSKCGLCSGSAGKGKKNVKINLH